ncbi:MAG: D-hexose-6-phosphate mutarotase [bacterium]|nr:D-hexose-6-phosphate mutarotase [bacterium]
MSDTVEMLNQRYGAAGRIAFREGPGGMPLAVLIAPQGSCEVSLYGGQVLTYRVLGYQDALWLSPLAEFSAGKAIRGGIPICWPWFGAAPKHLPEGTPSHGFARKSLWRVAETTYGTRDTEMTLILTHEDATDAAWPYKYELKLTIALGDCLTLTLQTRNMDDKPFIYSEALHTYLRVGDAREISLVGVKEAPMHFEDMVTHDEVIPHEDVMAGIVDPVMDRVLGIAAEDTAAVVVWHPSLEGLPGDIPLEGPRKFLCVEPANPHHTESEITLKPMEAHIITMRVQPTTPESFKQHRS